MKYLTGATKNAMILHPAKIKSMLLATRQKHQLRTLILKLGLKDNRIEQVHVHLHLSIVIDDKFSWRPHITSTCKTILKNKQKNKQTNKNKKYLLSHLTPRRHFQAKAIL